MMADQYELAEIFRSTVTTLTSHQISLERSHDIGHEIIRHLVRNHEKPSADAGMLTANELAGLAGLHMGMSVPEAVKTLDRELPGFEIGFEIGKRHRQC